MPPVTIKSAAAGDRNYLSYFRWTFKRRTLVVGKNSELKAGCFFGLTFFSSFLSCNSALTSLWLPVFSRKSPILLKEAGHKGVALEKARELSHYSSSELGIYKCKLVFSDYPWARKRAYTRTPFQLSRLQQQQQPLHFGQSKRKGRKLSSFLGKLLFCLF